MQIVPKRTDIKSILIIGAGPIVIGQACEFDYSGAQACKALKEEGYRIVLVNSNPATIMTDPEILADATYIEPITPAFVAKRSSPASAPRRSLADHGRADRAQHRAGAVEILRRAQAARRRADRRQGSGDRKGRGPSTVPPGDGQDRPRLAEKPAGQIAGRGAGGAGGHPACRRSSGRPSRPGRGTRRRHRLQHRGVRGDRPRRAPGLAGARGADRGIGARLEGIRSSKSCATVPTTASSSARSKTSTRWASTPATR